MISVVTGGTGFVGSHLVDLLLSKGHSVKCIVRKTSNLRWLKGKPVEIIDSGLLNKEKLKEILKDADYLFHVAGVVKAKDWEGYYKGNVESAKNLLESLVELNSQIKRVIVVSSQTVSGPSRDGKPVTEEMEPRPITRYGKSKLEEEKLVLSYKSMLPITIIRPPAIYGERDTEIYLFFKTYKQGLMTKVGFDKKLISIINVKDLVRGIYQAAMEPKAEGEIYFISSEKFYDWDQIGDATAKAFGKKAIKISLPHFLVYSVAVIAEFFALFSKKAATFNIEKARDFVQKYWICSAGKAKRDFGFVQEISLEEGIKQTIDWYKSEKWL